jgi:hypothetical protein
MLPEALVGSTHERSFICAEWELRVTARCLIEDLDRSPDDDFESLRSIEIIKAFESKRFDRVENTRQVAPLTSGKEVWVLARGHDHRGGTWYDDQERVVWLLASRWHRSGSAQDFFPYCKELDAAGRLLPTKSDYEALIRDRARRFAYSVRIEAPLILRAARETQKEQRVMLGGRFGARIAVEVADELEETTIAFKAGTVPVDYVAVILGCFHPDAAWGLADRMPSRDLEPDEFAFAHLREGSG